MMSGHSPESCDVSTTAASRNSKSQLAGRYPVADSGWLVANSTNVEHADFERRSVSGTSNEA